MNMPAGRVICTERLYLSEMFVQSEETSLRCGSADICQISAAVPERPSPHQVSFNG